MPCTACGFKNYLEGVAGGGCLAATEFVLPAGTGLFPGSLSQSPSLGRRCPLLLELDAGLAGPVQCQPCVQMEHQPAAPALFLVGPTAWHRPGDAWGTWRRAAWWLCSSQGGEMGGVVAQACPKDSARLGCTCGHPAAAPSQGGVTDAVCYVPANRDGQWPP